MIYFTNETGSCKTTVQFWQKVHGVDITHDNVCSSMLSCFYSRLLSTGRPISSLRLILRGCIFRSEFISRFSTLYANRNSCVSNIGFFSTFLNTSRSCRQGDPLSSYLFILAVEPRTAAIKNSDAVYVPHVNPTEAEIRMYANDTVLFLDGAENSLKASLEILVFF